MLQYERAEKLAGALAECLVELDRIEAHIAAAHLDSALQALRRQFGLVTNSSDPE